MWIVCTRGMPTAHLPTPHTVAFFKTFGELYPMKLFRVLLYPATTMTKVLWSMLRPFVHSHVQRRLNLISDLKGFEPFIARDQLLESLGGALPEEALVGEEEKVDK